MALPVSNGKTEPAVVFTSAERIRSLNAIDLDVTRLLNSAGRAIQALTNPRPSSTSDETDTDLVSSSALEARKAAFTGHAATYFALVKSVQVNLHRQVYALEEADIVPSYAPAPTAPAQPTITSAGQRRPGVAARQGGIQVQTRQKEEASMQITNGGLGNLDIGWLNSRTADVGKKMEAELWKEARLLLGKMSRKDDEPPRIDGGGSEDGMEVDSKEELPED